MINKTLNFTEQASSLYNRANNRLGLLKRTYHFDTGTVNLQHCPIIWRPSSKIMVKKLESIQRKALKWIRKDISVSYSFNESVYYIH